MKKIYCLHGWRNANIKNNLYDWFPRKNWHKTSLHTYPAHSLSFATTLIEWISLYGRQTDGHKKWETSSHKKRSLSKDSFVGFSELTGNDSKIIQHFADWVTFAWHKKIFYYFFTTLVFVCQFPLKANVSKTGSEQLYTCRTRIKRIIWNVGQSKWTTKLKMVNS